MKPELTPYDRALQALARDIKYQLPCCLNCEHFSQSVSQREQADEYCTLDPDRRRPPAKVIAFGCPAFAMDVPF